ncbi:beta-glucosidase-like glycosyl hydrolase [Catenuloplanes niger]|uniref:beta-glucosidase n=1 Tax=Catenuloplanes niger TaxID=587534 RepID=A0AAE4CR45_9ACTN|nr:discoidin domain-containing protein [Catenuloplanes niger]MDR7321162.1 beta-glucosidase-like glycosyl hydrolase [Catenuloplanes niger]
MKRRLAAALLLLAGLLVATPAEAAPVLLSEAAPVLLSRGKPTLASSVEGAGTPAAAAVDGDAGTRWASAFADQQWLRVDLGATATLDRVVLHWEAAHARAFQIQTSPDGTAWTTVHATTTGTGGVQTITTDGTGRYVRVLGTERATGYGYSLWEFEVYGSTTTSGGGTDIAAFKPVAASSYEGGNAPGAALDGRTTTRWSSEHAENQWIRVDLQGRATITGVVLHWESAYGTGYRIEVSDDAAAWTTIYSTTTGRGGVETLTVSGIGRYLRLVGTARATGYGYSLWDLKVLGTVDAAGSAPPLLSGPTRPPATTGQFALTAPADQALITDTRRPVFSWAAVAGATRYQLWINVSRTDYDFTASGSLLDVYTRVAEVTGTSYAPAWDLPDRWTYRWYVTAGSTTSQIRTFGLYRPALTTIADGVPVINGARDANRSGAIDPYEDWRRPVEARVTDLLGRMTAEEKAYQMFYNAQAYPRSGWHFGPSEAPDLHRDLLGSTGTRLGIPLISAGDTIHGFKTTYPSQSALAAGRDYPLQYRLGDMQRREQVELGTRGVLGPLAEVGTKVLYPRIQEGNGEDAYVAAAQVRALVAGLQGGPELNPRSVLATVKHWPGEGAGGEQLIVYDGVTIKYHMIPFRAAMEAGAVNIMPGYAGSSFLDPGGPGAGDSAPILAYLRNNLGFTGLITTDWLPSGSWVGAARAGSDVMGGADPGAAGFSMATFLAQVPAARIDDAVRRVLRLKFQLGLFENPYGDPVNGIYRVHTPADAALANQAARGSLTVLRNSANVLPLRLPAGSDIVVTGPRATDTGSCCIWTSYFHQEYGSLSTYDALAARAASAGVTVHRDSAPNPSLAIVAVGEPYYTHATSWTQTAPYLPPDQLELIRSWKARGVPVVVLLTMARPYVISEWHEIADAVVVNFRAGEEVGPALAGLVFGDHRPTGKLPWQLPRTLDQVLRPGGQDVPADAREAWDLPFDLGATDAQRAEIRAHIDAGRPVPPTYGNPLYPYGHGLTW